MKSQVVKRSVAIDGHKTSISLEEAFWTSLKAIAQTQGATVAQTVTTINETRKQCNLSSAVRLFVLDCVRNGQMGKQV
jgi:predicted DNA-binding ribbon-helix-helix protein